MAEEFSEYVDGFSIGSNDLTQLVLGLDRDSALVSPIYDISGYRTRWPRPRLSAPISIPRPW